MKKQLLTGLLTTCLPLTGIAADATKAPTPPTARRAPDSPPQWAGDDSPGMTAELTARAVSYGERDVIPLKTKVRYTTMIVLPKDEKILDFTCGDKEFWVVNGDQNFAYIKPAKVGTQTNLNLVTASGNIYSFFLTEVSETPKVSPDLKVFVDLKDDAMQSAAHATPRFVAAQDVEAYKEEAQRARDDAQKTKEAQQTLVQQGINHFVTNVRFPYRFEAGKKPFYVRAMYNDERFTYIQARPEETPTLYELKDGKPNLVNFTYKEGLYVVEKILDRGYLTIGKQRLEFSRED